MFVDIRNKTLPIANKQIIGSGLRRKKTNVDTLIGDIKKMSISPKPKQVKRKYINF